MISVTKGGYDHREFWILGDSFVLQMFIFKKNLKVQYGLEQQYLWADLDCAQ